MQDDIFTDGCEISKSESKKELGSLPVTDCQELINTLADIFSQKIADALKKNYSSEMNSS